MRALFLVLVVLVLAAPSFAYTIHRVSATTAKKAFLAAWNEQRSYSRYAPLHYSPPFSPLTPANLPFIISITR
jgi:hypothetical protein